MINLADIYIITVSPFTSLKSIKFWNMSLQFVESLQLLTFAFVLLLFLPLKKCCISFLHKQ